MNRLLKLLLVVVLAFVSGVVIVHTFMLVFVRSGAETRVPDVVGLDEAQARTALESVGFTGVQEREVNSPDIPAGKIAEQRPPAGASLRKGRKVWLTISIGERTATVPRLSGVSMRQAGLALSRERLQRGNVARSYHGRVQRGDVIAQNPPAGTSVVEGARVNLLESLGKEPVAWVLPDLVGKPIGEAERMLERAGIRAGEKTVVIDRSVLPGTIMEQDPPAGSRVLSGQRIDLVISSRR